MTILLDSELVEKYDSLVPQIVAAEIKYDILPKPLVEHSICFKREVIQKGMGDDLQVEKCYFFNHFNIYIFYILC